MFADYFILYCKVSMLGKCFEVQRRKEAWPIAGFVLILRQRVSRGWDGVLKVRQVGLSRGEGEDNGGCHKDV